MTRAASPRFDLGLYGSGWTTLVLAIAAAASGRTVLWLEPPFDPDLLPRPFPLPDRAPWRALWSLIAPPGAAPAWRICGGAAIEPLRRRAVVDASARETLAAAGGSWTTVATAVDWAWSEPVDGYAALAAVLATRLQVLPIERRPWPDGLAVDGRWWRRARIGGLRDDVRRWLLLAPATESAFRQRPSLPAACPRCGVEGDGLRWWSDGARSVLWRSGGELPNAPPGWGEALRADARMGADPSWCRVRARRLRVLRVPSPVAQPPSAWAAFVVAALRPLLDRHQRSALAD